MDHRSPSRAERRLEAAAREAYRREQLGTPRSARRIVARYRGDEGWRAVKGLRLDDTTARELAEEGVTLVRVRRAGRDVEIGLARYLG